MSIEAMKQALEALETCKVYDEADAWFDIDKVEEAAEALHLAIEQAEKQEPVAWMKNESFVDANNLWDVRVTFNQDGDGIPLYTAPPQRQPLTEEEYLKALEPLQGEFVCSSVTLRRIVRAIERKHGIGGGE
jgi:hypothetical protein